MQAIRAVLATATLVIGIVTMTVAQTDRASAPRFDTASVKPNTSATGSTVAIQGSGVRLIGVTARQLLVRAYSVESFDIIGGAGWIASDRFDVIAKTPAEAKLPQVNAMLRGLLVDRFHLVARSEKRERRVYFLVTARDDGKLGPSIKASTDEECGRPPTLGPAHGSSGRCRLLIAAGAIEASGQPLQALATTLASIVGRPVVDMTFTPGRYDFKLTFTPEPGRGGLAAADTAPTAPDASIFTAVQEQLGLKLEPHSGPADVLVIDHIERPDPD